MRNQRVVNPAEFLRTVGVPFIYSLIGEVSDAFITSPVLNSFSALVPRDLPDQVHELGNHGLVMKFQKLYLLYSRYHKLPNIINFS